MQSQYKLFQQEKHPKEVDETFHIFSASNISNVFFWNIIFEELSNKHILFDSIVECGVGRGRSLLTINHLLDLYLKTKILNNEEENYIDKIRVS